MSNTTQNTLKYANIQMAAEADFLGVTNFQSGAAIEAALVRGNNRSSRFTAPQVDKLDKLGSGLAKQHTFWLISPNGKTPKT
mgnify:CR=1 FL=1